MQPLNMKEIGQKVLEKNPYKLMRDDHNREVVATELTMFPDVLTFSVYQVGKNFQNIPFATRTHSQAGQQRIDVDLITIDGTVAETIKSSEYSCTRSSELYNKDKANFNFKSPDDTIIVALVLRQYTSHRGEETALLLLSAPHTISMMREKRNSIVLPAIANKISDDMKAIETLWA